MFTVNLSQTRLIFSKEIGQTVIKKTLFLTDWNVTLKLDKQNVDYSTEFFLNKIHLLLSDYTLLKKSASKS